jgi:hypothetical protein
LDAGGLLQLRVVRPLGQRLCRSGG